MNPTSKPVTFLRSARVTLSPCTLRLWSPSSHWSGQRTVQKGQNLLRTTLATLVLLTSLSLIPPESHAVDALYTQGCEAYPIALHESSLEGMQPGDKLDNIREGTSTGNFGWLRWTDDSAAIPDNPNSKEYLAKDWRMTTCKEG